MPAGVAYTDTGDLYNSDNDAHTVHLWRSSSLAAGELTVATDAARLRFPNPARAWGGKIFVSDNDGIKVLASDGSFEKLFRLYLGVFDFVVTDRGAIVASLMVRSGRSCPTRSWRSGRWLA